MELGCSVAMADERSGEGGLEPEDRAMADKDLTWPKRRPPPFVGGQATDPMNLSHKLSVMAIPSDAGDNRQ